MKLSRRDRRALLLLAGAGLIIVLLELLVVERPSAPSVSSGDSIPTAQKRLARVRALAGTLPGREEELSNITGDLTRREKGIIRADTLPQAQAQLLQVLRRITAAQSPPLDIRNVEVAQGRVLGDDYGEISVPVTFECRVEQLVNLLADITAQPELLAVNGLRISIGNAKAKTMNVRLTLAAVVPRKLVPERKTGGAL